MQVILIEDASGRPPGSLAFKSTPRVSPSALEVISVADALPSDSMSVPDFATDFMSAVATPAPDAALRSALYGRYVGQIDARIERAWRRPRSAIGAPLFQCLVRIDQDSRGTVLSVTLEQCNGSLLWQRSLVSAIEAASPLPAPPDPEVFTRVLHMSFQSPAYSSGGPRDGYEPVLRTAALSPTGSAEDPNERALAAFGRALHEPDSHQVITLTLTGSPTGAASPHAMPPPAGLPALSTPPGRPPAE